MQRIGPDILNPDLTWRDVAERLQSKAFSGRALNSVYLDQALLGWTGAIICVVKILFIAGINPAQKARDLSKGQMGKLARTTLQISQRSYALAGVTLPERQIQDTQEARGYLPAKHAFLFLVERASPAGCVEQKFSVQTANSRRIYTCSVCQPI